MTTRSLVLLLCGILLLASLLPAQETRATISGAVLDPSGAALPNVKITVTEVRTGVKNSTTADAAGQYNVPFLPPGEYEVRAEAAGFRPLARKGLQLTSSAHPIIDLTMQVGGNTETVEVTAEAPIIETANASVGASITTKQIEDLPLNGRNPMIIAQLALGVIATGNPNVPVSPFANAAASGWSIGGTPSQTSEIMIDGAPNATWDNRLAYAPPQEAVQEVKVKAFDGDAAFGHTGGGTINKVMRTGTNTFHGSAYYFMQPSDLAANNFFNNRAGIPVPDSKFNQWGGTAGGPVLLPKLFNGRNKLFWFFAMERITGSQPNTKFVTVPTAAERLGDFSSLLALGSNYQIYNPYSATTSGSTVTRQPFRCDAAGNPLPVNTTSAIGAGYGTQANTGTACNKLPAALLNPIAQAYLQFYPAPNVTGAANGFGNYGNSSTTDDDFWNELGRLDWNMSQRSRLSFNIRHTDYIQSKNDYFKNNAAALASILTRPNWGGTVDEVYTLNSSTVLNVRGNYTTMRETHPSPMAGFDPSSLGYPGYLASKSAFVQMPRVEFAPASSSNTCGSDTGQATSFECLGPAGADLLPSKSFSLFGDVNKQWRTHTLKFGVDARKYVLDAQTFGNSVGRFVFGSGWTQSASNGAPAPLGQDFAAFLLGLPTSGQYDVNTRGTYTAYYTALFLQDDWRIKRNLTLNLGLRWDHDTPYAEKIGRTVNGFAFGTANPLAAAAIARYNAATAAALGTTVNGAPVPAFTVNGGVTYPTDGRIYDIDSNLVSPRIGFAWSPSMLHDKTVVRGGFGLFVQPIALANLNPVGSYSSQPILTQEGFSQTTTLSQATNFAVSATQVPVTLSNPFPNGIQSPSGSANGLLTFLGQNVDFFNPQMKNPYSERWTFGFQHAITPSLVAEIAYIGNHSLHMPVSVTQLNGIPRQFLSTLANRDAALITKLTSTVPNPFQGLIPSVSSFNGATISVRQVLSPYPEFPVADSTSFSSGVTMRNANIGSSNFHSLNARVEKRLTGGLQIVSTFSWSKLMERDSYLNNTDSAPEKRISPFDRPFRFVSAVNYDLPIGRGKLLNLEGWADRLLGGWRVNGIYTFQSGAPLLWMNGSTNNPGDYGLCSAATAQGTNTAIAGRAALKGLCVDESGNLLAPAIALPAGFKVDPRSVDTPAFNTAYFVTGATPSSVSGLTAAQVAAIQGTGQFQFHLRTFPSTFGDLRQDGQNNVDASVLKKFAITESSYFQFRLEAFNLMNHVSFGAPNVAVTNASFGTITTQANRPRQIQIGFRFVF